MTESKKFPFFKSAAIEAPEVSLPEDSHSSYKLAYDDVDFVLRDELRATRLQLEWLKPDIVQNDFGIESTVVIFGSARIQSEQQIKDKIEYCQSVLTEEPENKKAKQALKQAQSTLKNARYYDEIRSLAAQISELAIQHNNDHFVVITGGGPGIMEAANRGANDAGGISIGLNIVLPYEQKINDWVTPELGFQFHYFAIRKMHFLNRACALIAGPGGFGTLDELFETLTLIQTEKVKAIPVILMGRTFWQTAINFDFLLEQGVIGERDLDLFHIVDTSREAWEILTNYWQIAQ